MNGWAAAEVEHRDSLTSVDSGHMLAPVFNEPPHQLSLVFHHR